MYTKADFDRDHPTPENPFAFPWEEEYHLKVLEKVKKEAKKEVKKEREKLKKEAEKEREKLKKDAEKILQQKLEEAEKRFQQIEKLKIKIEKIKATIYNCLELHQEGILSEELYLSKTTPLKKELKELEEKASVFSK